MRVNRRSMMVHDYQMKQKYGVGESDLVINRTEKKGLNYEILFRVDCNVINYSKNLAEKKNPLKSEVEITIAAKFRFRCVHNHKQQHLCCTVKETFPAQLDGHVDASLPKKT